MNSHRIPKTTLGRLPVYLRYLESIQADSKTVSATHIAKALGYGEVQVRKDLGIVSGAGKPKIGYITSELAECLQRCLGQNSHRHAVIVGAGKLGCALLDYDGFADYGLEVVAAFDAATAAGQQNASASGKPIYPMEEFDGFCDRESIQIGIITVPKDVAQSVCDLMIKNNISAIWSFAPCILKAPDHVTIQQENLALSLAHLVKRVSF